MWTPALFPKDMELSLEDGKPIFRMNVDLRHHHLSAETYRMAMRYKDRMDAECSDLSRPFVQTAKAKVCLRTPPAMPPDAERSGYCEMLFDIGRNGKPENVNAALCTEDAFRDASEMAVKWWRYYPAKEAGRYVKQEGVKSRVMFKLVGENGELIPEP